MSGNSCCLGELATFIHPGLIYGPNKFQNLSSVISLNGLRIAFCSEPEENKKFSIPRMKFLVSGDMLRAINSNDKYETSFGPTQ
ncbi:MAG: hypothetical protein SRB2_02147 [Desulfobacteraceae bacterium Eth-SRB2]|nr:MAG: hypothetical protein SRB2_02147 [Desulfobacteraceae bacterium Eth-SRB2]